MSCPAHNKGLSLFFITGWVKPISGFTLAELAIVLLIVGLLLAGALLPFAKQVELRRISETQKTLDQIREALIGFAIANGRLPCPATAATSGDESFAFGGNFANGNCSNFFDGFVPGKLLGVSPVDDQGFAIDAWNSRIRYAVASNNTSTHYFTQFDGIKTAGLSSVTPNLNVCQSVPSSTTSCGTAITLASNVAVVLVSFSLNGALTPTGADEIYNAAAKASSLSTAMYISHIPSKSPNEFDDIVTWLSPNILYNRMLVAGRLP